MDQGPPPRPTPSASQEATPSIGAMDEPTDPQPVFAVVRGRPDDAELAALMAVLLARLRAASDEAGEEEPTAPRAPWDTPHRPRPRVGWTSRT
jgi:hypothetical protein